MGVRCTSDTLLIAVLTKGKPGTLVTILIGLVSTDQCHLEGALGAPPVSSIVKVVSPVCIHTLSGATVCRFQEVHILEIPWVR